MDKKEKKIYEYKPTTSKHNIKTDLKFKKKIVAITTYHSSELLVDACKDLNYKFDLGIFDEAHRTVGEINKQFTYLLSKGKNISEKRLFMTATEKIYHYSKSKLSTLEQQEKMLPSVDYINNGFYSDMDDKFNLTVLLNDINYECDF